jgi:hypothetical protein
VKNFLSSSAQRPLVAVPAWILCLLALALAAQVGLRSVARTGLPAASDLPNAPPAAALRLASFGETAAFSRLAMLWLQAFDLRGDNAVSYQKLDYGRLIAWLNAILATDPRSGYPLFAAARVYADNTDPAKTRRMLEFIYAEFGRDPNGRWPSLAHATLLAKHRLRDLPLARRYAQAIQRQTTDPTVPDWAKQMEIFILEEMNELEAATVMLGGLLATGRLQDPEERRFLQERLEQLEERLRDAESGRKR